MTKDFGRCSLVKKQNFNFKEFVGKLLLQMYFDVLNQLGTLAWM